MEFIAFSPEKRTARSSEQGRLTEAQERRVAAYRVRLENARATLRQSLQELESVPETPEGKQRMERLKAELREIEVRLRLKPEHLLRAAFLEEQAGVQGVAFSSDGTYTVGKILDYYHNLPEGCRAVTSLEVRGGFGRALLPEDGQTRTRREERGDPKMMEGLPPHIQKMVILPGRFSGFEMNQEALERLLTANTHIDRLFVDSYQDGEDRSVWAFRGQSLQEQVEHLRAQIHGKKTAEIEAVVMPSFGHDSHVRTIIRLFAKKTVRSMDE